jgi:hypothetical protein
VNLHQNVEKVMEETGFSRNQVLSKVAKFKKDFPSVPIYDEFERHGGGRKLDADALQRIAIETMAEGNKLREQAAKQSAPRRR